MVFPSIELLTIPNASSLSSLGTSETEVYTGGSPVSGESATLGGYINQVIKTGTFRDSLA